jgi:hypothetical protein
MAFFRQGDTTITNILDSIKAEKTTDIREIMYNIINSANYLKDPPTCANNYDSLIFKKNLIELINAVHPTDPSAQPAPTAPTAQPAKPPPSDPTAPAAQPA